MAYFRLKALQLHSAPLSGCSARIRTVFNLKAPSIPLTIHNISLAASEQTSPSYLAVNPNASVPALIVSYVSSHSDGTNDRTITITQSPAIVDFLEHTFPEPKLLPGVEEMWKRARTLELVSLVSCDIQPVQSTRVRSKIERDFGGDRNAWARWVYERGFTVYERFLERGVKGTYSVGDEVTLADVFLVPAVQGGLRLGVELEKWPLIKEVVDECWKLEAFRKGGVGGHGRLKP